MQREGFTEMKSEYDSIISLGGFCGAASQLRARGLRPCSYPLDWVFMDSPESIEWLATAFANDFADFAMRDNLAPIERDGVGGLAPFKYKDLASGYCFIHHFWRSIDDGDGYAEFSRTMHRRIRRMLSCFSPGKSVLLILATIFPFERTLAERLLCSIREIFPAVEIDMHVMQFNVVFDSPQVESERWPDGAPFTGGRYRRANGDYDLSRTSAEWSFLDGISLRGCKVHKPHGLSKLYMKLWKWLSKRLRNDGYGVLGVRFRH